jgi:hypothetical protein
MMYHCRGLRVDMEQGDLKFNLLAELMQELPIVPTLDLAQLISRLRLVSKLAPM